jgi:RNA polymerase sigma-70 factor (ECF subfamily)
MTDVAARAAERAARLSYGRLVAYLARAWRDVSAAEDALGDAFARALERWPVDGVPDNPDAWLLTVARRRLGDSWRRRRTAAEAAPTLALAADREDAMPEAVPDERLRLMFVCAHPEIDPAVRTPLMLQTVLGLSAEAIASAFLVAPATMGQRLVRAKARIREAALAFELPAADDLEARADAVREAIYAAYGTGWDAAPGADGVRALAGEAIWLAEVLVGLLPDDPEARGLLALMLFCQSRAAARRVDDAYVPLDRQDIGRWDMGMVRRAERELAAAARAGRPGRFQFEAAIQSAVVQSRRTGADLAEPIARLHGALVSLAPTIGNRLGHAAAVAAAGRPAEALALTEELPPERMAGHQPWWALRGHLLDLLGRRPEAAAALRRAAGLSDDPALRSFLLARAAAAEA